MSVLGFWTFYLAQIVLVGAQIRDEKPQLSVLLPNSLNVLDVSRWTSSLHLQQCVIIEIGDGFCAIFIEIRDRNLPNRKSTVSSRQYSYVKNDHVNEYYLGLCQCLVLNKWKWCSRVVEQVRGADCSFHEGTANSNTDARVHRRLCDVTGIPTWTLPCDCSQPFANQLLTKVIGFPTCSLPNLPLSLCSPRSVCGVARCAPFNFNGIVSVRCDEQCFGKQPFCERPGEVTSQPRAMPAHWTKWTDNVCSATCTMEGLVHNRARCVHSKDGSPAFDCIGPGTECCPKDKPNCRCTVRNDNTSLVAERILSKCSIPKRCNPGISIQKKRDLLPKKVVIRDNAQIKKQSLRIGTGLLNMSQYKWKSDPIFKLIPPPTQDELYVDQEDSAFHSSNLRFSGGTSSNEDQFMKEQRSLRRRAIPKFKRHLGKYPRYRLKYRRRVLLGLQDSSNYQLYDDVEVADGNQVEFVDKNDDDSTDDDQDDDDDSDDSDDYDDEDIRMDEDTESDSLSKLEESKKILDEDESDERKSEHEVLDTDMDAPFDISKITENQATFLWTTMSVNVKIFTCVVISCFLYLSRL